MISKGTLFLNLYIVVFVVTECKPVDDKYETSDCREIKMPLLDNHQGDLYVKFNVAPMNEQLRDFIHYTLNSTLGIKAEQELKQKKSELKSDMLEKFYRDLNETRDIYDKEIKTLINKANANTQEATKTMQRQISIEIENFKNTHTVQMFNLTNDAKSDLVKYKDRNDELLLNLSNELKSAFADLSNTIQKNMTKLSADIDIKWKDMEDWRNNVSQIVDGTRTQVMQQDRKMVTNHDKNDLGCKASTPFNPNARSVCLGLLLANAEDASSHIAFEAVLTHDLDGHTGSEDRTIIFDKILTNYGNSYKKDVGIFVAPIEGVYLFAYTIHGHYAADKFVALVINGQRKTTIHADGSARGIFISKASRTSILALSKGDRAYIQIVSNIGRGLLKSDANGHNSFAGVLLFPKR